MTVVAVFNEKPSGEMQPSTSAACGRMAMPYGVRLKHVCHDLLSIFETRTSGK